ncbi:unnamed protein product [Pleuronectes platessa]|uniref:Uncharacterized protein n=1 Tax=Pleuronectes platessa TaxID=8262 RepID=A0A9N7VN46_PLEPL|nr:unnamed protein product [Pleuronectes platessa]
METSLATGTEELSVLTARCFCQIPKDKACQIPNSFMDGRALLRLMAVSDSCPGLASAQRGQGRGLTFKDNP